MRFTINGISHELTSDQVERAMANVPAEPLREYGVVVTGATFPVKQVLERATGLPRRDFQSQTARRILTSLGFQIVTTGPAPTPAPTVTPRNAPQAATSRPDPPVPRAWPWEGAVQEVFVQLLVERGWIVTSAANTATKAPGVDVLAEKAERRLGAEVKGWPSVGYADPRRAAEVKRTQPGSQAAHWYSQGLMKAMMLLNTHPGRESLVVLPDFPRYRDLVARTSTGLDRAGIHVVFLREGGVADAAVWRP